MSLILQFLRLYFLYKRKKLRSLPEAKEINKFRSNFYQSVWEEAAISLNLKFKKLASDTLVISDSNKNLLCKNNETNIDGYLPVRLSLDKSFSYSMLSKHHFKIPEHFIVNKDSFTKAISIFNHFISNNKSVTVKPANGTGAGMGITVDVKDKNTFILSFAFAGTFSDNVIIEETIKGHNYRLLFYKSNFLDAVQRKPPSVKGNGHDNIKELIKKENQKRLKEPGRAQTLILIDLELKNCLRNQGYRLSSKLPDNKQIYIKNVINDNTKYDNISVNDIIPEKLIKSCSIIPELFGLNIVGIDIITKDISSASNKSDFYVLEVNANPGFYYHYFKQQNKSYPVTNTLLKEYFKL